MSKLDKDQVIENFTAAYKAANGKEPSIEAKGGWYSVDGGKNIRLAALEEMTAELASGNASTAEAKSEVPAKAEKAPAKKKAAPQKAPAKKKAASGGFSVKAFWNEQIESRNPGSKRPR